MNIIVSATASPKQPRSAFCSYKLETSTGVLMRVDIPRPGNEAALRDATRMAFGALKEAGGEKKARAAFTKLQKCLSKLAKAKGKKEVSA